MKFSKQDQELYKEKLPEWQEKYTEGLLKKYVDFLKSDAPALDKFHELEKKIKKDKNTPGVQLRNAREGTEYNLMKLIQANVITFDDLEGFSDEMIDVVKRLVKTFKNTND